MQKLLESEEAFKQVLRYDPGCEDAIQEINKVRKKRIVDMGFTELQAKAAIKKYVQVQVSYQNCCSFLKIEISIFEFLK